MKKTKIIFAAILLIVTMSILGVFTIKEYSKRLERGPTDKISVRLSWLHQAEFAGFYVAKEKGLYKNSDIDIVINSGGVDFNSVKMVAAGSDHFGVAGADEVIIARSKEIPIKAVAALYQKNPICFIALKNANINEPSDFIGKKLGVKYGKTTDFVYRLMMKKLGVPTKNIIEVPVQFNLTPLFTGQVDVFPGFIINEPLVAKEKGFDVNVIYPSDYGIPFYANVIFATEKLINEKPDLIERFLRATLQGWEWAIENPEGAVEEVMKYGTNLDRQHQLSMMEISIPLLMGEKSRYHGVGWMEEQVWEEIHRMLLDYKLIQEPVDLDGIYTMEFLAKIYTSERDRME